MARLKHPIFISVDTEFTDGDLAHGELLQVGMVEAGTGLTFSTITPISTEAKTNDWVKKNLAPLVQAALMQTLQTNHLQQLPIRGAFVPSVILNIAVQAQTWVYSRRKEAFFQAVESGNYKYDRELPPPGVPGKGLDPRHLEDFPAVMVTYCGGYDFGFIDRLFSQCGLVNPFHYEMVDIASLAMALGYGWDFKAADLEADLGLAPVDDDARHDALFDAKRQLEVFQALCSNFVVRPREK